MARSVWNGTISFGMVSIPVALNTAVQEKDLRFHQIHSVCGSRIRLQKYCPVCERVVENEELQKGFELSKSRHALLSDEDFESVPVPTKHTIDVLAFVKAEEVDPVFFDSAYLVAPSETGRKPYALLARALESKGMSALGKIALRQREKLCLIRFSEGRLMLETLHFPDEIRNADELNLEDVKLDDRELAMATSLVDLLTEEFQPEQYRDEYREALMERIQAKAHGEEVRDAPEAPANNVIDLMEALRKSVDAAKKAKEPTPKTANKRRSA